ncbi:hypothetical protein [Aquimarina sp. 2201CG5-10]|uniref:hypothetical protein n=1 Tax=Aquimarina callyspongiae TaxID=3098150 RepID=UPI002AB38EA7|nr:hypothetical protein [Aquimarina sp. 2201CG5-10]MDY8135147.1 hypothetical protein [Aquimarina sp. 2201CG5-10]
MKKKQLTGKLGLDKIKIARLTNTESIYGGNDNGYLSLNTNCGPTTKTGISGPTGHGDGPSQRATECGCHGGGDRG